MAELVSRLLEFRFNDEQDVMATMSAALTERRASEQNE
jgi:hypothetical protein